MILLRRLTTTIACVALIAGRCSSAAAGLRTRKHAERNPSDTYANNPMARFLLNLDVSLMNVDQQLRNLPQRMKTAFAEASSDGRNLQSTGDIQVAYAGTTATKAWVSVPVPYKDAQTMSSTMSFNGAPAVKGQEVGIHTVFYDVLLDLPANGYLIGDLVPPTAGVTPAPTSFALSPWVSDDINRLIPQYTIISDGTQLLCGNPALARVTDTAAHQMYKLVTRCGGIVIEFYAHLYNDQDVVEWELLAIFSDYSVPDVDISIDSFSVTFGEVVMIDDHIPLNISSFVGTFNEAAGDTWTVDLVQNTKIGHGQSTPVFKGALLCLDNSQPFVDAILDPEIVNSSKWSYLLARLDGKILAGRTNWDERWLAFQATIPKLPQDDAELESVFNSQYNMMLTPQDLFASRKLGLNKNAGSTGMQADFGSQKGTQATHGDLRFAATWHYHLQESMRPIHFREASGTKTTSVLQPNWVTWSQVTHYHPSVSPNQLGKPNWWSGGEFHGWTGKDDQHKSSNALNAAIATQDWPAYRSILLDEINVALENVRFLPGQDPGAPRAIGRRMLADANAYLLSGNDWVWERLVLWHATNALSKSHVGQALPNTYDFMRVSEIHYGDKPPFLCAETTNCIQGQHAPLPKVIVWQHGLLMKGLVAAWNTHLYRQSLGLPPIPGPDIDNLKTFIIDLATTFARHFVAQVNGEWQTWNYIAWNNGNPVNQTILSSSTDTAGYTHYRVTVNNAAWWDWHFAGYYYLARSNHGLALPADVVFRLDSMANETETDVFPNSGFVRREWYPFTAN